MAPDDKPDRNRPRATPDKPGPILDLKAQRTDAAGKAEGQAAAKPAGAAAPGSAVTGAGSVPKPEPEPAKDIRATGTPGLAGSTPKPTEGPAVAGTPNAAKLDPMTAGSSATSGGPGGQPGKPSDPKPVEAKTADVKPVGTKSVDPKAVAPKAVDSKSGAPVTAGSPPTNPTNSTPVAGGPGRGPSAGGASAPGPAPTGGRPAPTGPATGAAAGLTAASTAASADRAVPVPASARAGVVPALTAGLLGVLVGAGLVYGYETYGAGGEGETDARVAALEQRLEGLATRDALGAVDRRIGSLEGTVRPLPDAVREARTMADAAGAKATEALQRPSTPQAAAAVAPPVNVGDLPGRVADIGRQVAGLRDELNTKMTAGAETDATLDRRLGALDKALNGRIQANAEAEQGLGRRLEEQDRRLADLAKALSDRPDAAVLRAGFRLAAANRVAVALATGTPYAEAVAALRALKVDDAALAPLARFAETGAPTAGTLARAFDGEAQRIAAAERAARARTASADGSFTDRLASMAESIVTIRRTGSGAVEASGGGTGSVAADLARGDVPAAARAWDGLSEAARGETATFGARLKARAQADEAARSIADAALAAVPGR